MAAGSERYQRKRPSRRTATSSRSLIDSALPPAAVPRIWPGCPLRG
jgi:hypothetical protein